MMRVENNLRDRLIPTSMKSDTGSGSLPWEYEIKDAGIGKCWVCDDAKAGNNHSQDWEIMDEPPNRNHYGCQFGRFLVIVTINDREHPSAHDTVVGCLGEVLDCLGMYATKD